MLTQKLLQYCTSMTNRRFISQTVKNFESKSADSATKASHDGAMPGRPMYVPSNFDKFLLVWVKKYPRGQVPEKISEEVIYQAKSKARIKTANYMIFGTALMCLSTVLYAKKMAKSGDSIQKRQDDWRKEVIEQGKNERESAS